MGPRLHAHTFGALKAADEAGKLRWDVVDGIPPRVTFRQTKRHEEPCGPKRMPLLLVLLTVLAFGSTLGGMAALFHSHGPSGGHLHLFATHADPGELGTGHDRHAAQHRHGREDETDEDEQPTLPAPEGLLLELPQILAVVPSGQSAASTSSFHVSAQLAAPRWHLALAQCTHRFDLCHSGWPPQRRTLSGVAALLRSSHAILI